MTERICPRCGSPQNNESENSLHFCWHCGLAQVVISEELREIAAEQSRPVDPNEPQSTAPPAGPPPEAVVWRGAILAAALTGAIAAALTLLSLAFPGAVLFAWLWAVGAPVIALGLYSSRFRRTRIGAGFGARLGLLCGLAIFIGIASVNTAGLLISRYIFHGAAQFDAQLAAFFSQVSATTVARSDPQAAAPFVKLLTYPEFRAGVLLSSVAFFVAGYLVFSAAGGAFAGLLRARRVPK